MNVLVVSATEFEIQSFTLENNNTDILITGVGIPATIFHLTKRLLEKKYDFILQAGIGGTFNSKLSLGDVVIISEDTFGDIGIDEKGNFKTLFETSFINENDFPFTKGWLINNHEYLIHPYLPTSIGITVNKITDDINQIKKLSEKFNADIESMEGAALHYVCLAQNINFLQLRSISNIVGERNKQKWKTKEAITNLNIELKKLIQEFI